MAGREIEDLSSLATPGTVFDLRVTPRARRVELRRDGERIVVRVNEVPEDGRANTAVIALLARALGVAKGRLTLTRGATSRDKRIRLD